MNFRRLSTLPAIGGLAVLYLVVAKLSLRLAFVHASASSVWPVTGIALAAVLLIGYRVWPAILIGAFFVNDITAGNFLTSLLIAGGNTLEAVCGAWLISRWVGSAQSFDRARDVFKFSVTALASSLISATVGVTALTAGGFAHWQNYTSIWLTWWLANAIGDLVIAPLIILWSDRPRWRFSFKHDYEVALLFIAILIVGEIVFGGWLPVNAANYPISFLCGPVVIWTAFRFSQRESASAVFILTAMAAWGTLHQARSIRHGNGRSIAPDHEHVDGRSHHHGTGSLRRHVGTAAREAAIEKQKTEVETANKTKDNFLAMLSHELRTPLTPVLAALDVLEAESPTEEDCKAAIAMIRRNVELESQLIDDLLDLTRIARENFSCTSWK